jgi:hypothetical protein
VIAEASSREALVQRRAEIARDAEDGLVTAVNELASIDARLAELDRRPEPLDVAGVLAALDEVAPPAAQQIVNEERIALTRRRQEIAPELVAGDEGALTELATIEARIAELDRAEEFERLAAVEIAERERAAAEREAEKKRDAATRKLAKLDAQRNVKLTEVETAMEELVQAIGRYGELELEYGELRKVVNPDAGRWNFMTAISDRLYRHLREVGLHELDFPYGTRGLQPLGKSK